jgi:hypothetical protein
MNRRIALALLLAALAATGSLAPRPAQAQAPAPTTAPAPAAAQAAAQPPAQAPAKPLIPPLKTPILDPQQKPLGEALVYPNFIELNGQDGALRGAIGVVVSQGRTLLFLVRADSERRFIGWAEDHRLYNTEDQLVGYYFWTPIWSYVYDPKMKKVGQAQCLAYQGVCAAGVAGYLLGLL